jgi:hypothetical protein
MRELQDTILKELQAATVIELLVFAAFAFVLGASAIGAACLGL